MLRLRFTLAPGSCSLGCHGSFHTLTFTFHFDFHPHLEGERALKTLELAQLLVLHAVETQNAYFHLSLEEEIAQRWAEYRQMWEG